MYTIFAFILASVIGNAEISSTDAKTIPNSYRGIWKIVSMVDDDGNRHSANELDFADKSPVEVLILEDRLILVKDNGSTVMAYAEILENGTSLTLDLRTGIAHDKERSATYWNLKLDKEELVIELAVEEFDHDPGKNRDAIPSFRAIRPK